MESYIPLVKAIVISAILSWGTSEVVITDQYILKENIQLNQKTGSEIKEYQVYDIKRNEIHCSLYNLARIPFIFLFYYFYYISFRILKFIIRRL